MPIDNNLRVVPFDPMEWKELAACKNVPTRLFFPGQGEPNEIALRVCRSCPVTQECLKFALDNYERFGVWGGKSEKQRRNLRSEDCA